VTLSTTSLCKGWFLDKIKQQHGNNEKKKNEMLKDSRPLQASIAKATLLRLRVATAWQSRTASEQIIES